MKIPKEKYESKILRGKDLEDTEIVTIREVGWTVFEEGTANERKAVSVTVDGPVSGSFALNMDNTAVIVGEYGDDTDKWIGRDIRVTPVASKKPDGTPTRSIAVGIPKKGDRK